MVLDFTAVWCPPCKKIGPIFVAMASEPAYANSVTFRKLDVDQVREVAQSCQVGAFPTFVMFVGGIEVERVEGAIEDNLRAMITRHKKQSPILLEDNL